MFSYKAKLEQMIAQGLTAYTGFPGKMDCGNHISRLKDDATQYVGETDAKVKLMFSALAQVSYEIATSRTWKTATKEGFNDFAEADLSKVLDAVKKVIETLPEASMSDRRRTYSFRCG